MEHLNYCRQMVKQMTSLLAIPSFTQKGTATNLVDLANASQKFMLPDGGIAHDDPELRALDESEPLCLPFPFTALEWHVKGGNSTKRILFARQREESIALTPVVWSDAGGNWRPMPECELPRVGYLSRTHGQLPTRRVLFSHDDTDVPASDYRAEIDALLFFLNILQCKNVHVETSRPRKIGKVKSALPFDTYHVLMIDVPGSSSESTGLGTHRSPREHLRRGHIRRLADSRRIWINATVVGAGRGSGVVSKDYAFKAA